MIVDEKGGITVDGRKATMKSAISESHLLIGLGTFDYDLFYEDGVVALVPVNAHKISFTNELRPFVYFSSDKYMLVFFGPRRNHHTYILSQIKRLCNNF